MAMRQIFRHYLHKVVPCRKSRLSIVLSRTGSCRMGLVVPSYLVKLSTKNRFSATHHG